MLSGWRLPTVLGMVALAIVAAPLPGRQPASSAVDTVKEATRHLYAVLQENHLLIERQPGVLYKLVEEALLPHADIEAMSRWVLGKYWREASEAQRRRFEQEFRRLLVRTYAAAVKDVVPGDIRYLPERPGTRADSRIVRTEVQRPDGPPLPINYYMYLRDGKWKLYDVRVEGISLITNYRSSFASEIRSKGIDGLISELAAKNDQESGGH